MLLYNDKASLLYFKKLMLHYMEYVKMFCHSFAKITWLVVENATFQWVPL